MPPLRQPILAPSGHVFRVERARGPVWYAKYRLPDGRQVQRKLGPAWTERGRPAAGYLTKRTAEGWLRDLLYEARRGTPPGMTRSGATFADAAAEYLRYAEHDRGCKPSTLQGYHSMVRAHLLPAFGSMPIEAVTTEGIERWIATVPGAPRTRNKLLILLHGILRRARKLYRLPSNAASDVEKFPQHRSGDIQVFSPEEIMALVRAAASEQDAAIFLEHRMQFSPQWSVLYGIRGDLVQLDYSDPLGGPGLYDGYAQSASTAWYGLYNGNISVVYSPTPHISTYLTYNKAQYVQPTANDGAVATWGEDPTMQLRQNTLLEEGGVKFDLFDKRLFISAAGFYQERSETTGPGGLASTLAHIKGAEVELNYQPSPHFFATASYSYLHTTLDYPSGFYNFPPTPGINFDGGGAFVTDSFAPNQTFQDPGVPQQLFNLLANYKHESGLGVQGNIQVTGPVQVSQSGYLDLATLGPDFPAYLFPNNYLKAPIIHWQYTLNTAVFYTFQKYTVKFSIYNVTDRHNLTNDIPFYGNDFLTRQPPTDFDLSLSARF